MFSYLHVLYVSGLFMTYRVLTDNLYIYVVHVVR